MTDDQTPQDSPGERPWQFTIRLNPKLRAKFLAHVERLQGRVPKSISVTPTMTILDVIEQGFSNIERVERDKKRSR